MGNVKISDLPLLNNPPDGATIVGVHNGTPVRFPKNAVGGGTAEIGDTIEVNKINFSRDGASTSTSITRDDDRLRIVSGDSLHLSSGHAGSILMYDPEETIFIEGETKSIIQTYKGAGETRIEVEDDGQDTGLVGIRGRKNVSIRSDGALHIGIGDSYGSAINFYDDDSGIEIDTNNLALGKISQIYASTSKDSSGMGSGEPGQVLTSNGDGDLYWGDASGGDSSITDLGEQGDHKEAQSTMFYSLTDAENGCYLFKYYCNCSGTACFSVVYVYNDDASTDVNIEGTVYDNVGRYRKFVFLNGEPIEDGCWLPIASYDEEIEGLNTVNNTILEAINEINAKVGSGGSGGSPLYRHTYAIYAPTLDSDECEMYPVLEFISSKGTLCETLDEIRVALDNGELTFIRGYCTDLLNDTSYTVSYIGNGYNVEEGSYLLLYLTSYEDGNIITVACTSSNYYIISNDNTKVVQITSGVGGSSSNSGGGAGLSMPRIRLANWKYTEIPAYDGVDFLRGRIVFSVNVQDGTVQEGDELQVCALKQTFGKRKLRPILSRTITAEDIENLAKQPYLQITTDDRTNNTLSCDLGRTLSSFYKTDSNNMYRNKPKYIRIRRPVWKENANNEVVVVNAFFSNVVPVDIRLRYRVG